MAITLTALPIAEHTVELKSNAKVLTPVMGGVQQRINSLGDRFSLKINTDPMMYNQAARIITDLNAGLTETVIYPVPQPFTIGNPGSPQVSTANQRGRTLALKGLANGFKFSKGMFITVVSNGTRYLHQITTDTTVSGTTATVAILPMLRVNPSVNDVVQVQNPTIEGFISGNSNSWTVSRLQAVGLTVEITEAV